jgi:NSS family neurotransmitter:Na+ symporter
MQEQWRSRRGFILASIAAAVGLGNIWRFAYVAGENGGAVFLVVYLLCVLLIGAPLMIAELAVGRHTRSDAIASIRALAPAGFWPVAGGLGILGSFLIMSFYLVVAGWALKYFVGSLTGSLWQLAGQDYGGYFEAFIAHPIEPVFWQFLMMAAATLVVARGVVAGIERVATVLMPMLALTVLALALYSLSHAGAGAGLSFLFTPRWSLLQKPEIYLAALGQAFFSLSIGMALYLTYGSYLAREHSIPGAVAAVIAGDTAIAVLSGIAIFPTVFAFGMDPAAGPRLVFITLPQLFLAMPAGTLVGPVFFFLLAASAVSASVSGIEVPVAYVRRRLSLSRQRAAALVGGSVFLCGLPASLGYGVLSDVRWNGRLILESMDFLISNSILPIGGLLTALFVGWRWGRSAALRESDLGETAAGVAWLWALRIVVPALIVAVLLHGLAVI